MEFTISHFGILLLVVLVTPFPLTVVSLLCIWLTYWLFATVFDKNVKWYGVKTLEKFNR